MDFLNPLFLAGLAAAFVPIAIHLMNRRRAVRRPFPALDFLRRSQKRVARRLKLRQLLLLALRVLAIGAVVLAMSKPYLISDAGQTDSERLPVAVAFVVDDSASMTYADGAPWDRAIDAVEERLDDLRPWDRATLVFASAWPAGSPLGEDVPVPDLIDDHPRLLAALEGHRPSERATDLVTALRTASDLLAHADLPNKRIVLITDRQRTAFKERDLPSGGLGIDVQIVDVRDKEAEPNLAVVGADYLQQSAGARPEFAISALVKNFGESPRKGVEVQLVIDGSDVGSALVDVEAGATATATFVHRFETKGVHRASLRLATSTDLLVADNVFQLPIHLSQRVRVLLVNGDPRSVAYQDELFYLDKALVPSARSQSGIIAESVGVNGLAGRVLGDYDVLVLANVEKVPRSTVAQLLDFVRAGGGLFITAGSMVKPDLANSLWGDLLPKPLRSVKVLATPGDPDAPLKITHLGRSDVVHPVFKVFSLPGGQTLQSVEVYSYLLLQPTTNDDAKILLSYADGAPAMLEKGLGQGRVVMLTTTIDRDWTDFPIRTAFLPTMRRLMRHLARRGTSSTQATRLVGHRVLLEIPGDAKGRVEVRDVEGGRVVVTPESAEAGAPMVFVPQKTGQYSVVVTDQRGAGAARDLESLAFAVNVDPAESDLAPIPLDNLSAMLAAEGSAGADSGVTVDRPERRIGLWSVLLFIVTLLLLAETVLGTRRSVLIRLANRFTGRKVGLDLGR